MMHSSLSRAFIASFVLLCPHLQAEIPKLDGLFPAGGQVGTTFTFQSIGKNPPTSKWWCELEGVQIEATEKEQEWKCSIPKGARPGLYRIFTYNEEGRSEVKVFVVGSAPDLLEVEPNNVTGKGQAITSFPVAIQARLQNVNDVDTYQVSLKKDQTLFGRLLGYTLTSPVDPLVHILNAKGQRIFTAMDARNLDPEFYFQAPEDGDYTIQIAGFAHIPQANENYTGGPNVVYRLFLNTGTTVTHFTPPIAPQDAPFQVTLQGHQIPEDQATAEIQPQHVSGSGDIQLIYHPLSELPIQAVPPRGTIQHEIEPNNDADQSQEIVAGMVAGLLNTPQDVDRYRIAMKPEETFVARVWAQQLGLLPDTEITILNPTGGVITSNQDIEGQNDPRVQWKASAEGFYTLVVRETMRRSSPNHHYLLEVGPPVPSYKLTTSAASKITLAAGKEEKLKINLKRLNGWNKPLVFGIDGLPEGVTCDEVPAPEGDGEVELTLKISPDCPLFQGMIYPVGRIKTPPPPSSEATSEPTSDAPAAPENSEPAPPVPSEEAPQPEPPAPPVRPDITLPIPIDFRGDLKRGTSLVDEFPGIWLTVLAPEKPPEDKPAEGEKSE